MKEENLNSDKFVDLLQNKRNRWLCWVEPHPARNEFGENVDVHIKYCASVEDCINIRRLQNFNLNKDVELTDEEYLAEFIAINWATIKEEK